MRPRQKRFVEEYLIDLNAHQAAIRAGYAPRTPHGRELIHQPEIVAAIRTAMAARAKRVGITPERVLEEYARIAFADIRLITEWGPEGVRLQPDAALSDEAAAAIAGLAQAGKGRGHGIQALRQGARSKAWRASSDSPRRRLRPSASAVRQPSAAVRSSPIRRAERPHAAARVSA